MFRDKKGINLFFSCIILMHFSPSATLYDSHFPHLSVSLLTLHSFILLLLSRFSRVRLCATPQKAAHQAPPSLGFSRQEHWSGLPFPSPAFIHTVLEFIMRGPIDTTQTCILIWWTIRPFGENLLNGEIVPGLMDKKVNQLFCLSYLKKSWPVDC